MSAPRWLRALARPGATLGPETAGKAYAVWARGDRRRRPLARPGEAEIRRGLACGWIEAGPGGSFVLTTAGRRTVETDRPGVLGADRRRRMVQRLVMTRSGRIEAALANVLEGPLGKWAHWLDPAQLQAGERFVRDYHRSTLSQHVTRNWSPTAPRRGEGRPRGREEAAVSAIAAKDRIMGVLERLEGREAQVVEAVLIREESLAAMDRRFGRGRGGGKAAVKAALTALDGAYRRL